MKLERSSSATAAASTSAAVGAPAQSPEWDAPRLRPVAHWVVMPTERGNRLTMVWETPDPLPLAD